MKPIPGFSKYAITADGVVWRVYPLPERRLVIGDNGRGYKNVRMKSDGGVIKHAYVHRLVLLAYVPIDKTRPHVNHKDGDRSNNRLENLEWCTRSENMRHAVNILGHGRGRGELSRAAKISDDDVRAIRSMRARGALYREIAAEFGLNESWAYRVATGKAWAHVR